ncbi:MAG TPA: D-alanine--D-alanine ligase [Bacteroidales bacterium]|jgi:D-alanine-D-alanine ligase|nr:D-alanine--D-alanine ligase [Bacteroidales bacterium]
MKKTLAIVTGGNSSEYIISVKSADTIHENIDTNLYDAYRVEIKGTEWKAALPDGNFVSVNKNDFSFLLADTHVKFDAALIMIHGDPGENGKLQGYFDMLNIPYTASNVLSSSATFSKHFTKQYLKSYGILSADWILLSSRIGYDLSEVEAKIGFPCFVKPNNAGSSFGVSKVSNIEQLKDAVKNAMAEDDEVLVEKMIEGTEITCGVLRTSNSVYTLPVTEIVSKTGFFDYEAKYTEGMADEIVPARINDAIAKECQELSLKIYDLFHCHWFARVDYILSNGNLFLLEINTIPGMSKESIIPKMLRADNLSLSDMLNQILDDIV